MAELQNFADWLFDKGYLLKDPNQMVQKFTNENIKAKSHPSGNAYCDIPNCRNLAPKDDIFCKDHR
jgi:hypothetical protein